jgi:phage replication O-like protein O
MCTFPRSGAYRKETLIGVAESQPDRFVRFPLNLLETLLKARLSGTQWRTLLWVVRHTHGWNREWVSFTWYRIAKETGLDRAAAFRAGTALVRTHVLLQREERIAVQMDSKAWDGRVFPTRTDDARQLWMPGINVDGEQRRALPTDNAAVAGRQRHDCQATTLFRRGKDRYKDRLKTYKDRSALGSEITPHDTKRGNTRRLLLAGAARPIPGKYDGISQD